MITIGIDTVEVNRFINFHTYADKQLLRFFSYAEITYARSNPLKSAERFAVRFAAKEAFLKAYTQSIPLHRISLRAIAPLIEIIKINGCPQLHIQWDALKKIYDDTSTLNNSVTLTHSTQHAIAVVVLYQ